METISLLQMFQSPLAAAELGANPFAQQLGQPGAAPVPGEFTDLLGLVEDMEIADSQDAFGREGFSQDLAALEDGDARMMRARVQGASLDRLAAEMNAAELMALNGESIGQPATKPAEIASGSDRAAMTGLAPSTSMDASELMLQGFASAPVLAQAQPSAEAVQHWSLALARDEISEVSVQKGGDGVSPKETAFPRPATPQPQQAGTPAPTPAPVQGESLSSLAAVLGASASTGPTVESAPKAKAPAQDSTEKTIPGSSASPVSASAQTGDAIRPAREAVKAAPREKAMQGSEFLLEKSVDRQIGSADFRASFGAMAAGLGSQPAVAGASDLGQPHDARIQPQTLSFVADKVGELKSSGGGSMKVALNPEGMGLVEIRVGIRAGQVHVTLTAEKPETQMLLQGSKSLLAERLAGSHDARIEIGGSTAFRAHELKADQAVAMPTDGFVSAHRVESTEKPVLGQDFVRSSIETASRGEAGIESAPAGERSSNRDWSSDHRGADTTQRQDRGMDKGTDSGSEGRDRAFAEWQRSMLDRKIA